ncbi:hypothetical protein Tco_0170476 [Tanacetum coccineum]
MNLERILQQQSSSVSSDLVSKYINPSLDACIDSILNQDTQPDSLINVPISVAAETPSYVTTIPQPPNLNFDQRVSALETEMFEVKQTNQFAEAVSSIPGIVDTYLASRMKDAVDVAVQL